MIDRKLIDLHQWIVDETEKKPAWWAAQVIKSSVVADIVLKALRWDGGWDALFLFLTLCVGGMLLLGTRSEPFLKSIGSRAGGVRCFFLAIIAFDVYMHVSQPSGPSFLRIVSAVLFVSYYYFAACDAPRPKKRKEKLVLKEAT